VKGHSAYFAGGYGGQFIYVVPDLDIVVVITSSSERPHIENRDIVGEFIIPAVLE
jgi:CubicO group peptidase (beta-lactamase class C family)